MPVSTTDAIDFYKGLERGLAPDLETLFLFARLSFVRRVEHMDAYKRAFLFHFYGIDVPRVAKPYPFGVYRGLQRGFYWSDLQPVERPEPDT